MSNHTKALFRPLALASCLLVFSACSLRQPARRPSLVAPLVWSNYDNQHIIAKRGQIVVGLLVKTKNGWYAFGQNGEPSPKLGPPGKLLGGPFSNLKKARQRAEGGL